MRRRPTIWRRTEGGAGGEETDEDTPITKNCGNNRWGRDAAIDKAWLNGTEEEEMNRMGKGSIDRDEPIDGGNVMEEKRWRGL